MSQPTPDVHGSIVIFQHCTFEWRQPASGFRRIVAIESHHCERCIAELERRGDFTIDDRRPKKSP